MNVAYSHQELEDYLIEAEAVGTNVVISKYVSDAKVCILLLFFNLEVILYKQLYIFQMCLSYFLS